MFKSRHKRSVLASLIVGLALCGQASSVGALDLLESYSAALSEDAQFLAAQSAAEAGRESVPMARAQLRPNISASAGMTYNDLNTRTQSSTGVPFSYDSTYQGKNYALTLRQSLYRPIQYAGYQQAKARLVNIEATLDKEQQDLALRVAGAYFNVLLGEEQLRLVQSQIAAVSAQLLAATRAMEAGHGTRTDIDDAQARLDINLADELGAQQQIENARHELQTLINRPVDTLLPLNKNRLELSSPSPGSLEEWITLAEANNAELRDMRARSEISRHEVEKARAGHKPTLDLVLQHSMSENDNVTNPNARYINSQIGVQFSMPLYAGGYVSAQVRQAVAGKNEADQRYEAARRKLGAQLRKEFQAMIEGVQKIHALEQAERSGDQAVISNQKGVQAGTRSRLDVLNAEQQRSNTRLELARERLNYAMARLRLSGLGGKLDMAEVAAVNRWLSLEPAALKSSSSISEINQSRLMTSALDASAPKL